MKHWQLLADDCRSPPGGTKPTAGSLSCRCWILCASRWPIASDPPFCIRQAARPVSNSPMAETNSTMVPLGAKAPEFGLPDTNGKSVSLADFTGAPALVVMFICNHCPYVKHLRGALAQFARDYI